MTQNATPEQQALGTVDEVDGGRQLRFERRLDHPVEKVWAALTEPDQLEGWLAAANELELVEGGRVVLRWLNTSKRDEWERYDVILPDDFDPDAEEVVTGTVTVLEPRRVLELDTDSFGVLRWELREELPGSVLTFTNALPAHFEDEMAPQTLAGWHSHLDLLAEALDGHPMLDWSKQSLDEWARLRDRYAQELA